MIKNERCIEDWTEDELKNFIIKNYDKSLSLDPSEVGDDFLRIVGLMTLTFSALEESIRVLCGNHIRNYGSVSIKQIITSEYSFKQLIKVTRSILIATNRLTPKNKLFDSILKIEQKRNIIIHSQYSSKTPSSIYRIKKKNVSKGYKMENESINVEFVKNLVNEMQECQKQVYMINQEVRKLYIKDSKSIGIVSEGKLESPV